MPEGWAAFGISTARHHQGGFQIPFPSIPLATGLDCRERMELPHKSFRMLRVIGGAGIATCRLTCYLLLPRSQNGRRFVSLWMRTLQRLENRRFSICLVDSQNSLLNGSSGRWRY